MRTVEELIEEIRFNTNRISKNRFTNPALIRLLNSAQRQIQRTVFLSNPKAQHFTKDYIFDYNSGEEMYSLPSWAYIQNSTFAVFPLVGGNNLAPIPMIDEKERQYKAGYYVKGKKIFLPAGSVGASVSQIRAVLWRKLPELSSIKDTPDLPDVCEDFLTLFVERKMNYIDSSKDIINSGLFTMEEKKEIGELFNNSSKDINYPPVTDTTYFTY